MSVVGMITSVQDEDWLAFVGLAHLVYLTLSIPYLSFEIPMTGALLIFISFGIGFPASICWFFYKYGNQVKAANSEWSSQNTPYSMWYDKENEVPAWYFNDFRTATSSYIMPPGFRCKRPSVGAWPNRTWVQYEGLFAPGPFGVYHLCTDKSQYYFCFKTVSIGAICTMIWCNLSVDDVVGNSVLSLLAVIRVVDVISFFFCFPYKDLGPSQADCANWGTCISLFFEAAASVVQAIDSSGATSGTIFNLMMMALFAPLCSILLDYSGLITMIPGFRPEDTAWMPLDDTVATDDESMTAAAVEMADLRTYTNPVKEEWEPASSSREGGLVVSV